MKGKIKEILFYGGVDKAGFREIADPINRYNRILVNVVSGAASALVTILFFLSYSLDGIGMNHSVYGVGAVLAILMLIASLFLSEKFPGIIHVLVYMSYIIFYTYGILIGTLTDPDGKTVTFMVMLVFLPVLFTVPPIETLTITLLCNAVFIYLCFQTKSGPVLVNDVVDALLFGFLGSICGVLITCMKIRSHMNEHRLREVSRSDKLTGMDNRNAYELDLYTIPKECKKSLACIYIDANGLKIMNDTRGHKAGDKMLKSIAEKILEQFGEYHAYRVGGDEFIVFAPDVKNYTLESRVDALKRDVEATGNYVAVGWDNQKIGDLSLSNLTKNAEAEMYKDKTLFYKNSEHERRRR